MTMIRVNASVEIHQHAPIHTIMILTHASVSASLTSAIQVNILTLRVVAANVKKTQRALTTNTSMRYLADVSVRKTRNVETDNTMTMIHVNVNVKTHQRATPLTSMTHIHASVCASLIHVLQASTMTIKRVAVGATNTSPALTTNSSTSHLVSASAGL